MQHTLLTKLKNPIQRLKPGTGLRSRTINTKHHNIKNSQGLNRA